MRVPGCTREYMTGARSSAYSERTPRASRKMKASAATRVGKDGVREVPSARAASARPRATRLVDNRGSLLSRYLLLESATPHPPALHAPHGPFRLLPDHPCGDPRLPGDGDRLPGHEPRHLAHHPSVALQRREAHDLR